MTLNMEVTDFEQPWQKLNLVNGSTVNIVGEFLFKSEKPAECMTLSYDKAADTTYNYYSCKNCGINWVCEQCKDTCHVGHEILPHLLNHRPNFACCYCVKKGLCKIKNIKNK